MYCDEHSSAFSGEEALGHPNSVPDITGSWEYPTDAI